MTNLQYRLYPEVGHLCKVTVFYFLGLSWLALEEPAIHSESTSNLVKRDKFHASYSGAGGTSLDGNTPPMLGRHVDGLEVESSGPKNVCLESC